MNSVKIISVDKNSILHRIQHYIDTRLKNNMNVKVVYLFGSFADNTYLPSSDIDLLIILKKSAKTAIDRIPDFIPDKLPIGCDVIPVTEEELHNYLREGNTFFKNILSRGKLLFIRN